MVNWRNRIKIIRCIIRTNSDNELFALKSKRKGQTTPLANENLRKALALGIDKENLVNNIIADGSKALHGAITEGFVANPTTGLDFRQEAVI